MSMGAFIVSMLLISSLKLSAQTKLAKEYRGYLGNYLSLHSDSTFDYKKRSHMSVYWAKGVWALKEDTLYLKPVSIYDTITSSNSITDSLILSSDYTSQRLFKEQYQLLGSGGQYLAMCPKKMIVKRNRLYNVSKGFLAPRKQRGFLVRKKYRTWFVKTKEE